MDSIYPDAIDGYSQLPLIVDGVTTIDAGNINAIRSAIVNIETEIGITPSGSKYETVGDRFDAIEDDIDAIELALESVSGVEVTGAVVDGLIRTTTVAGDTLKGSNIIVSALDGLTIPGSSTFNSGVVIDQTLEVTGATDVGDFNAAGTSAFNGVAYFNTDVSMIFSNGESLQVTGGTTQLHGQRYFGASAGPPAAVGLPSPTTGDRYFDTNIGAEMYYDSTNWWLTVETYSFEFGRNGTVPVGGFFRRTDGKAMTASIGELARYDGTLVGLTISRNVPPAGYNTSYAVMANGTNLAVHTINGTATYGNFTTRNNFSQNQVLSVGVDTVSTHEADGGTLGTVYYKWRT
jgi:hypothetical protein